VIRAATEAEASALADLLFRNPQPGRLLIGQDRRPDFFARSRGFPEATTLVVDADDGPAATVTVARKDVAVRGAAVAVGYVFDLAVDEPARGRGHASALLTSAEAWARERGAALLYANIMGGNERSLAVFARAGYDERVEMRMRLFPIFRDRPAPDPPPVDWELAARHLAGVAKTQDLAPVVTAERLRELWRRLPGWRDEDLWVTKSALLGLWDHRMVSRPIPLRLPVELRLLGVVGRLAALVGIAFPRPVEVGEPEEIGYVVGGLGDPAELQGLLLTVLGRAEERGLDVVAVAHEAGRRPAWARGAFSVAERYDIVARPLDAGLRPGSRRPVWADPIDL
jgi:GNAT superfamily N-acetyltransferase